MGGSPTGPSVSEKSKPASQSSSPSLSSEVQVAVLGVRGVRLGELRRVEGLDRLNSSEESVGVSLPNVCLVGVSLPKNADFTPTLRGREIDRASRR